MFVQGCTSTLIVGDSPSWFTSPNYPNNYNTNLNCVWLITTDFGKTLRLQFQRFDTDLFFDNVRVCCNKFKFSLFYFKCLNSFCCEIITSCKSEITDFTFRAFSLVKHLQWKLNDWILSEFYQFSVYRCTMGHILCPEGCWNTVDLQFRRQCNQLAVSCS